MAGNNLAGRRPLCPNDRMRARGRKRVLFSRKKTSRNLANESKVRLNKSLAYSYANYPTHRPGPPPDWRVSDLALQQWLGLLPRRWHRLGPVDCPDPRACWLGAASRFDSTGTLPVGSSEFAGIFPPN